MKNIIFMWNISPLHSDRDKKLYQHETDHKDRKTGICGLYPSAGQNLIQEGQKDEKKDQRIISGADCSSAPDSTFCVSPGRRCMDILDLVAAYGNGGNAGHRKAFWWF